MDLQQSHVVNLLSQTNIYGSCLLEWPPSRFHLLTASLNGSVSSLDYQLVSGQLRPSATHIQFMYLPADAEVVSMDCFCQLGGRRPVVGITLVKPGQGVEQSAHFLNIYGARRDCAAAGRDATDGEANDDWKSLGEDWQTCHLSFAPLKLCHVAVGKAEEDDVGFLLSGSDCRVHFYRCSPSILTFAEADSSTVRRLFPEFSEAFPACVTALDVKRQDSCRLVAIGLQSGDMRVYVTNLSSSGEATVLKTWQSSCFEGPTTSIRLLHLAPPRPLAPTDCGYSLVATCAVEMAAIFHLVKLCGFTQGSALAESSKYDSVLCSCVADLDGDGKNEVIIGTYGQMLLVYKQDSPSSNSSDFQLVFQQQLAQPVYALFCCDIVGDGLKELLAVTFDSVVIFQQNLSAAADRCVQRLKLWKEMEGLRGAIAARGHTPSA